MTTHTIRNALPVKQGSAVTYIASMPIKDLIVLAEALKPPESTTALFDPADDDVTGEIIDALNRHDFVKEVKIISSDVYDKERPYQRFLDRARAQEIALYLSEEEAILPNVIILAVKENAITSIDRAGGNFTIKIEIDEGRPANIVDGQHRIEALRILYETNQQQYENYEVAISILVDLPYCEQAELFAIINGEQRRVNRSQLYDLLGYLPGDKAKAYTGAMALYRFGHRIVKVLNQSQKSPWAGQIKMRGIGSGSVSQAAFIDQLVQLMTPRKNTNRLRTYPFLFHYYVASDLVGVAKLLIKYFAGVQQSHPELWPSAELKDTLFGRTNGVVVLFMVLHALMAVNGGEELSVEKVKEYWTKVPKEKIRDYPKGGSGGYQHQLFKDIMPYILGADWSDTLEEGRKTCVGKLIRDGALIIK